jgi:tetratricopeptide (TPR) repeat protein
MIGDDAGAKEAWDRAVKEGRRIDKLTLALFLATKDRDHDEALAAIIEERKTRGGPHVDDVYAWALFRAGKLEEAKRASEAALEIGTRDARILYHAGAIRIASGDVAGGVKLVKDALALNPKFDLTGAREAARLVAAHDKTLAGEPSKAGAGPNVRHTF